MKQQSIYKRKGFTLVELMVSIGITAVLLTALGVITSNTQEAVAYHKGNMNTDSTAWDVFNSIEQDLRNKVEINNVQIHFKDDKSSDDSIAFYTNRYGIKSVAGFDNTSVGKRKASWVHYLLDETQLKRGSRGLDLAPTDFISVLPAEDPSNENSFTQIENQYYQSIAKNVLRLEITAIQKETKKTGSDANAETRSNFRYVSMPEVVEKKNISLETTRGIVVTIVTIDDKLLKLVQTPKMLKDIKSLYPSARASSEETLSDQWSTIAENVVNLPTSIPLPVRQNMQVFERVIWF